MSDSTKGNEKSTDIGERKIIEMIQKHLDVMPNQPVPFGDDIAAVNINEREAAILKTDMLVGKTDVPANMSLWQAARKAIVMNVSDFASKGVQPKAALVSLGLTRSCTRKDVEEIGRGLNVGAREYSVYVIGGDTGETSDLVIAVSLYGTAKKNRLMLRSGAKENDILAVTGFFGKSAAGLRLLTRSSSVPPDLREMLLSSVCMPKARLKEGLALGGSGAATASIDSSDGLAWSLHELSKMSNVGFTVTDIPIAEEVKQFTNYNNLNPIELALYGGEEYELVVTIKPKFWAKAKAIVQAVGGILIPIGKVTAGKEIVLESNGKKSPIEARGWEHFKTRI